MFLGDRGDQCDVWFGDVSQYGNFTWQAGAELDHGQLRFRRQGEERQWNADAVVQISTGGVNGKRPTERCLDQVFRARFAVAASDADDGLIPGASPVMSQRAQRDTRLSNLVD